MIIREYRETDKEAAHRIWKEVGWLDEGEEALLDFMLGIGHNMVADFDGTAECLVLSIPGDLDYLGERLPFCGINGVTTSQIIRKRGAAGRVLAQNLAWNAQQGALVAGLGIFDQGFYDKLGFGTGPMVHSTSFDPRDLSVPITERLPVRLLAENWQEVHDARVARLRGHGSVSFKDADFTRSGVAEGKKKAYGLGYRNDEGVLTHYLWMKPAAEHGPTDIWFVVYQTTEQLMELLGLIKSLGDQYYTVNLQDPTGVQLQDLIRQPFRRARIGDKAKHSTGTHAAAWWQMRMLDVPGCLAETHLPTGKVSFNLELTDPIERYLEESEWKGVGGQYVVTLGTDSSAEPGCDATLPTLKASVNAFTRMWLGVLPATSLAITDDLTGPKELLEALDWQLRLPKPSLEWGF